MYGASVDVVVSVGASIHLLAYCVLHQLQQLVSDAYDVRYDVVAGPLPVVIAIP